MVNEANGTVNQQGQHLTCARYSFGHPKMGGGVTSWGGHMIRAFASQSHSEISRNLKDSGSSPDLAFSGPGRVKPMALKIIPVTS